MDEPLINGHDIATKTFQARTKRGYDPAEVDAYLKQVAAQVDALHERSESNALAAASSTPESQSTSEAERESVELMLRIARKTSEEALGEARVRADEIVAEANFRAAQLGRESDRKAFEAASRTQAELQAIEQAVADRQGNLTQLESMVEQRQAELRGMAETLLGLADGMAPRDVVVDLTAVDPVSVDAD